MRMKFALQAMALTAVFTACPSQAETPPWVQAEQGRAAWPGAQYLYGSGEGLALSRQAFAALTQYVLAQSGQGAERHSVVLDRQAMAAANGCGDDIACQLRHPIFTGCKAGDQPAVIFDADETLLLNLGVEYANVVLGQAYTPQQWAQWERDRAAHLKAAPGAVEMVNMLRQHGIKVIIVTNRDGTAPTSQSDDPRDFAQLTIDTLAAVGLGTFHHVGSKGAPQDLFLAGENGDQAAQKDARRKLVAANYCVVAMAGDQLGDFSDLFARLKTTPRRAAADDGDIGKLWGQGWFVLPNTVYGTGMADPGKVEDVFPDNVRWTPPTAP